MKRYLQTIPHRKPTDKRDGTTFVSQLGPGLITGVADDDPSGIATYSQTGAAFGYGLLWSMVFTYPLITSVQMLCGRIGLVTGKGLAANIRELWGTKILMWLVLFLVTANVINIGADLMAMAEALHLLIPGPVHLFCVVFGLGTIALQVFIPYSKYVSYLKWLTFSLFAYVIALFFVHVSWPEVIHALFVPEMKLDAKHVQALLAILGTTISPYLFFWQASEEVEEQDCDPEKKSLLKDPSRAPQQLKRVRMDTLVGMGCCNLVAAAIVITTASTLHAHGQYEIETAAQAAQALKPIAGSLSSILFALGIIGTGLLAIPVLAGASAYAVSETFGWDEGLEKKVYQAKNFYAVIAMATLAGVVLNMVHINAIKALIWAAILNGVVAVPMIAVVTWIAGKESVMGQFRATKTLTVLGWVTFAVMLTASLGLIFIH